MNSAIPASTQHAHSFLGAGHETSERKTWTVIWLCGAMMVAEIVGGLLFGSIALVADGLHMSTHAGALLLAALAYSYSRKHVNDVRFSFGTGKLGDLAGFTSAIVLAMIALLIGYESIMRLFAPVPIHFAEAIPIACFGLAVNIASVWLLSGSDHGHGHGHGHGHAHGHGHNHDAGHDNGAAHEEAHLVATPDGNVRVEVFEDGVPPRFRLRTDTAASRLSPSCSIVTIRPDGTRQEFVLTDRGDHWESSDQIPEPHAFVAQLHLGTAVYTLDFDEHEHSHGKAHRDNNMRAAVIHVIADAAVSILVIMGLILAKTFGWLWMDPLAGMVGACVIASWSYGLVRDTGAILLDMLADRQLADQMRNVIEADGDRLDDLHLWRVGPGHLAAIVCVATRQDRDPRYYRGRLSRFKIVSHLTVEVISTRAA